MPEDDALRRYREKRRFDATPEPSGEEEGRGQPGTGEGARGQEGGSFVVQKHAARRLHYDVRFEVDGVMPSWAVPKGPSYDPTVKRLAMHVEDHPLDYQGFEGVIPGGNYGAGTVMVWDAGTYRNITERHGQPVPMRRAIENGHVSVWLEGSKLRGGWSLTRTSGAGGRGGRPSRTETSESGGRGDAWLMIKRRDERADPSLDIESSAPASVQSGRDLDTIAGAGDATWTAATATWQPPMLAELTQASKWSDKGQGDWSYERKLDGLRCLAVRNGTEVELWSRNHKSFTARFPEIVDAVRALRPDNFTLDGEVVAHDGHDFLGFATLQQPGRKARAVYAVFDLLHLLGRDTRELPLTERQALLAKAVEAGPYLARVEPLTGQPADLLADACKRGWEGLVTKRTTSPYTGGRSPDWRKLKCSAGQELVIGGWTEPHGSRVGLGALLVGHYEGDELRYAGKVGTGFTTQTLRQLHGELARRERKTSPFADRVRERETHWVTPDLVADIAFAEWTRDGRLRQPRYQGLRPDKDARSVVRERPTA